MQTSLPVLHAKDIVHMTEEEAKDIPLLHFVQFTDGSKLLTSFEESYYTRYAWELFRVYQNTAIIEKHHLGGVLKGKPLNASTHQALFTNILRSIVADENLFYPEQKEPLLKMIYEKISTSMSGISLITEECVTSIDILDFIQIAKHPVVEELREGARLDPQNKIKYAYENTIKAINTLPEFKNNGLAKAVRSEMVKMNQVVQCVSLRGYPTEVDGSIFQKPILSNYLFGNTSLYDFVADSRTAAKSHYYSDTALKDSEYTARKFQLFASVVERINYVDCGSTEHKSWLVRGESYDKSGTMEYPGDLPMLLGKYYLDEDSGKYLSINGSEKHLIGKIIKMRSVIHCKDKDPHAICHVCAGGLSANISRFANVGHLGSVTSTKDLTQSILSIKHVNTSSTAIKIVLRELEQKFLNIGKDGTGFYLNKTYSKMKPRIAIAQNEAIGLGDLSINNDLDGISLTRLSAVRKIEFTTEVNGRDMGVVLDVQQKLKPSLISRPFLKYVKEKGWKSTSDGSFIISMEDWDYSQPMFVMPNKEESFVDLAAAVETLVSSNQKLIQQRLTKDAASNLLEDLFELINSKLKINILALEIIVYSLMVESSTSYGMGRNSPNAVLGTRELLTKCRSLGPALAYENQHDTLLDPITYYKGNRPDSPMDVFLAPREVVQHYKS